MSYTLQDRHARVGEMVKVDIDACGTACDYREQIVEAIQVSVTGFTIGKACDNRKFGLMPCEYKVVIYDGEWDELMPIMCDGCGCALEEEDNWHNINGETFCDECYEDRFFECERCGNVYDRDNVNSTPDGFMCNSCFERFYIICHDCDEVVSRSDSFCIDNGRVCGDCYSENYTECYGCGSVLSNHDVYEHDGEYYCERCHDNLNDVIGDYHHTEVSHFFNLGGEKTCKFIGFELEVEERGGDKNDAAKNVLDRLGSRFIECKYDGSLNNGFEIVTQPATYAYHAEQDYERVMQGLVADGMRSHDPKTCGLHFHVSRKFFKDEDGRDLENIAKMLVMIGFIWDDIVKFSRRDYYELSRWAKKNTTVEKDADNFCHNTIRMNSSDRYQALNLTNSNTIEFRFFRGTLRAKTFRASLEWVELFTRYAVLHTLDECFSARWFDIFEDASDNFKEYAYSQKIGIPDYDHDSND